MMIRASLFLLAVALLLGVLFLRPTPVDAEVTVAAERPDSQMCNFDAERSLSAPIEELLREEDPALGNPDSDVIVVEFFDPNCVHCHSFHDTWKEVVEAYEDRVRFHKLPFPLWEFSLSQVEAMLVANRAGRYYDMIDMQIEQRRNDGLSIEELAEMGAELGFDRERFAEVLQRQPLQREVQERRRQYSMAGVQSTPTVTINGEAITDRSASCLSQKIEEALANAE